MTNGARPCPRCGTGEFTPYGQQWADGDPFPPALSRIDNKTYICSKCGLDEAVRDFTGKVPIPISDWPLVAK